MPAPEPGPGALTEWSREALIERVRELEAQRLALETQLQETQEKLAEARAFIAELQRRLFGPKAEKLSSEQEQQLEQLACDLQEEARKPPSVIRQVLEEEQRARRKPRPRRNPCRWPWKPRRSSWSRRARSALIVAPRGSVSGRRSAKSLI